MSEKSETEANELHFRHLLLFFFRETKTEIEALEEIVDVYGPEAIDLKTCQYWFKRFKNGNFSLEEEDDES